MSSRKLIYRISVLLLFAATHLSSYGQYINKLHDYNHTFDWGWDIKICPDSNYFVVGWSIDQTTNKHLLFNESITKDGNTILDQNTFQADSVVFGLGDPGQSCVLSDGGYLIPACIQRHNPITGYLYSAAGFIKFNSVGDTVFLKIYTDTSVYFDLLNACGTMPDGGFIGGGGRSLNTPTIYPGLVIRTDNNGDTIWTKVYQKHPSEWVDVNTISSLDDGRILIGAMSTHQVILSSSFSYNHSSPWFIVLDSMGNILKDTIYSSGFAGNGNLYKDMNGGYIHIGRFDSLFTSDPSDNNNFPGYVAHLDTNFRITWIREFVHSNSDGHREPWGFHQLKDSSYIVYGDRWPFLNSEPQSKGWASKIDRSGNIVWSHTYHTDTGILQNSYLRDMTELPNGDLVFIGAGFNDTLPAWHQHRDIWLLGVDSNGCEVAGCGALTSPRPSPKEREVLRVWPNPSYGNISVEVNNTGTLYVYNVQGQEVGTYTINAGETHLRLPVTLGTGLYLCKYVSAEGDANPQVIRLMYEQ